MSHVITYYIYTQIQIHTHMMLCYVLNARNNYYYQLNFTERFNHEFK